MLDHHLGKCYRVEVRVHVHENQFLFVMGKDSIKYWFLHHSDHIFTLDKCSAMAYGSLPKEIHIFYRLENVFNIKIVFVTITPLGTESWFKMTFGCALCYLRMNVMAMLIQTQLSC